MDRRLKIFLACGLGSSIGTIVALSINTYLWWIGMLVGGLAGYLSYEFKEVLTAIRQAWHSVIGWRPDKEFWRNWIELVWYTHLAFLTVILSIKIILILLALPFGDVSVISDVPGNCLLIVMWISFSMVVSILHFTGFQKEDIRNFRKFNPFSVYFYYLPISIWWCLKKTPSVVRTVVQKIIVIGRFIKTVFILIYSDLRLLCGFGAAIGTAIGYFTGSVIIGMLAGAVIGILNYEFLSKRLLYLVPSKNH